MERMGLAALVGSKPMGASMRQKVRNSHVPHLVVDVATGCLLGVFGSLSALVVSPVLFRMIVSSPNPELVALAFVAGSAATIAIGSATTGYILYSAEND
jgi:hypothetical protein